MNAIIAVRTIKHYFCLLAIFCTALYPYFIMHVSLHMRSDMRTEIHSGSPCLSEQNCGMFTQ